jgi:hypothetical protein
MVDANVLSLGLMVLVIVGAYIGYKYLVKVYETRRRNVADPSCQCKSWEFLSGTTQDPARTFKAPNHRFTCIYPGGPDIEMKCPCASGACIPQSLEWVQSVDGTMKPTGMYLMHNTGEYDSNTGVYSPSWNLFEKTEKPADWYDYYVSAVPEEDTGRVQLYTQFSPGAGSLRNRVLRVVTTDYQTISVADHDSKVDKTYWEAFHGFIRTRDGADGFLYISLYQGTVGLRQSNVVDGETGEEAPPPEALRFKFHVKPEHMQSTPLSLPHFYRINVRMFPDSSDPEAELRHLVYMGKPEVGDTAHSRVMAVTDTVVREHIPEWLKYTYWSFDKPINGITKIRPMMNRSKCLAIKTEYTEEHRDTNGGLKRGYPLQVELEDSDRAEFQEFEITYHTETLHGTDGENEDVVIDTLAPAHFGADWTLVYPGGADVVWNKYVHMLEAHPIYLGKRSDHSGHNNPEWSVIGPWPISPPVPEAIGHIFNKTLALKFKYGGQTFPFGVERTGAGGSGTWKFGVNPTHYLSMRGPTLQLQLPPNAEHVVTGRALKIPKVTKYGDKVVPKEVNAFHQDMHSGTPALGDPYGPQWTYNPVLERIFDPANNMCLTGRISGDPENVDMQFIAKECEIGDNVNQRFTWTEPNTTTQGGVLNTLSKALFG